MGGRILVIDDEKDMLMLLRRIISEETDHHVTTESDPVAALGRFRNEPFDLVLTDLRMPNLDGIQVLESVKSARPDTAVIILTAYATIETAVDAVQRGAYDYITKPFRRERILLTLDKVMAWQKMVRENAELRSALAEKGQGVRFVGSSPVIEGLLERARQVAPTTATVLITGPSGSGKEVLARFLHQHSSRRARRMVTVNCAAIPEQVLESELFGHVKGAFTGAFRDKKGLAEEAHGGTLFLDEIGDLSLSMQTKLLRLLQDGEYKPVGGVVTKTADIRIVAATNHDLWADIRERSFREDLFYRLNVIHLKLPPLRGRSVDIAPLAQHFLEKHVRLERKSVRRLSPAAVQALMSHDFPGNVRELENIIERAVILCCGDSIELGDLDLQAEGPIPDLPDSTGGRLSFQEARGRVLKTFHVQYISSLLEESAGNISQAARAAGIQRQYLHRLMRKAGIDADEFKPGHRRGQGRQGTTSP